MSSGTKKKYRNLVKPSEINMIFQKRLKNNASDYNKSLAVTRQSSVGHSVGSDHAISETAQKRQDAKKAMKNLFMKGLPFDDKNAILTPNFKRILNERIKKADELVYGGD